MLVVQSYVLTVVIIAFKIAVKEVNVVLNGIIDLSIIWAPSQSPDNIRIRGVCVDAADLLNHPTLHTTSHNIPRV